MFETFTAICRHIPRFVLRCDVNNIHYTLREDVRTFTIGPLFSEGCPIMPNKKHTL